MAWAGGAVGLSVLLGDPTKCRRFEKGAVSPSVPQLVAAVAVRFKHQPTHLSGSQVRGCTNCACADDQHQTPTCTEKR